MNYQEKVATRADVRGLYEKVCMNPTIEKYRGYTDTKSYGWDEATEDYVKCEGEAWFENPKYDPNFIPEGTCCSATADLLDEQLAVREGEIRKLEAQRDELCRVIDELNAKLAEAQTASAAMEGERDRANSILTELRGAFLTIRKWIANE